MQKYVRSRLAQMHEVKEQLYDLEVEYERYNADNEHFLRRFQKGRRLSRGWLADQDPCDLPPLLLSLLPPV